MLVRDMFGLSEDESEETVSRCYVRMLEAYRIALQSGVELPRDIRSVIEDKYRKLEDKGSEVNTDLEPVSGQPENMDEKLYEVMHTLAYSSDIEGCRRAASGVREYLEQHPGSVMGEALLQIISEQMRE